MIYNKISHQDHQQKNNFVLPKFSLISYNSGHLNENYKNAAIFFKIVPRTDK